MKYIFILTLITLLASCTMMTSKEIQAKCIKEKGSLSACLSIRSVHFQDQCSGWYVCSGRGRPHETPEEFSKRCECKNEQAIDFILRRMNSR